MKSGFLNKQKPTQFNVVCGQRWGIWIWTVLLMEGWLSSAMTTGTPQGLQGGLSITKPSSKHVNSSMYAGCMDILFPFAHPSLGSSSLSCKNAQTQGGITCAYFSWRFTKTAYWCATRRKSRQESSDPHLSSLWSTSTTCHVKLYWLTHERLSQLVHDSGAIWSFL